MLRFSGPHTLLLLTAATLASSAGATPPVLNAECLKDLEACKARAAHESAAEEPEGPAPRPSPRASAPGDTPRQAGRPAPQPEAPPLLSNRHLGLARDQLDGLGFLPPPAEEIPPPKQSQPEGEWRFTEDRREAFPEAASERAPAGGFATCVETAIRGGSGLAESQQVCRALHPEGSSPAPAPSE
jgi:hypothetical protein